MTHGRVHVYEYGESSDDQRAAFYVDERAYADADPVLEIADAAVTRLGVIYSIEVSSGADACVPHGVPSWEEFRQHHIGEGVPLPVRPAPDQVTMPPSWDAMSRTIEADHERFRDDLVSLLGAAFPAGPISVHAGLGPLRRSPASIEPHYHAPPGPGASFVTEPRPPPTTRSGR